ncbi:hypothetical protein CLV62_12060 [Dysgonomonas alginatilytica]|uniref:Minor structural protein GP20 n=1 Tax=Dysgonomonas alginatilytica TaxID=1605892 RepID=A0A2V3PN14_9BACT|nr:hypothetical protein [Dysgonomonas alginatilytica]PXV62371.1 hypothetical protein CLV62_12060 [Dysgonomonas alginatilytica]
MEKEKLSTDLKGLVGETSLSQRTWDDYLEHSVMPFLPTEEDKIGDYISKHANALKSMDGQLNHDVAEKVNDFKKSYKPIAVNSQQPTVDNPDKSGLQNADNEKLTDLESRMQRFEKAEAEKKEAVLKTEKLDEAKKLMQEQGASHETVLNLILPQLQPTEEISVSDLAKKGKEMYDKAYADLYGGDSYVPAFGGGSSNSSTKTSKDAYMKHLRETGRIK